MFPMFKCSKKHRGHVSSKNELSRYMNLVPYNLFSPCTRTELLPTILSKFISHLPTSDFYTFATNTTRNTSKMKCKPKLALIHA